MTTTTHSQRPSALGIDIPRPSAPEMDVRRSRRWLTPRVLWIAAGAMVLAAISGGMALLASAPPTVPRTSVWIDVVQRGDLRREVGGPGKLVPQSIRWVQARTAALVEALPVEPGSGVEATTVIAQLRNPDLELEARSAAGQLSQAELALADLRAGFVLERLENRSRLAKLRTARAEARRRADSSSSLAMQEMISALEHQKVQDRVSELSELVDIEEERSGVLQRAQRARLAARQAEVSRLRELASHQQELVESLSAKAGLVGVVQELPLELGQRVAAGQLLAKVIEPHRLEVELRIPEKQAEEIAVGQRAWIEVENVEIEGRVARVDPAVIDGSVTVDVSLEGELPRGARPDLSVDGRIELERLQDVLYTGRPAFGKADSTVSLFRVGSDGVAERVTMRFGGSSVSQIQVLSGLAEGDRVVLSDMSRWDAADRIRLQ